MSYCSQALQTLGLTEGSTIQYEEIGAFHKAGLAYRWRSVMSMGGSTLGLQGRADTQNRQRRHREPKALAETRP